ncbi:MAG: hypothetical protein NW241_07815 [Bacteroidia bacterium]|nr:hypothetical protein [Bacteroidia bacterium]
MIREKSSALVQVGVGLLILGFGVHLAMMLGRMLYPLANLAILIGIVLAIIGLVAPGRRNY